MAPKVRRGAPLTEENALNNIPSKPKPSFITRVAPKENIDDLSVYVHPESVTVLGEETPSKVRILKLIPSFLSSPNRREEDQNEAEETWAAKALFATLILSKDVPQKHVWIGSTLRRSLEVKDFDIIK